MGIRMEKTSGTKRSRVPQSMGGASKQTKVSEHTEPQSQTSESENTQNTHSSSQPSGSF